MKPAGPIEANRFVPLSTTFAPPCCGRDNKLAGGSAQRSLVARRDRPPTDVPLLAGQLHPTRRRRAPRCCSSPKPRPTERAGTAARTFFLHVGSPPGPPSFLPVCHRIAGEPLPRRASASAAAHRPYDEGSSSVVPAGPPKLLPAQTQTQASGRIWRSCPASGRCCFAPFASFFCGRQRWRPPLLFPRPTRCRSRRRFHSAPTRCG